MTVTPRSPTLKPTSKLSPQPTSRPLSGIQDEIVFQSNRDGDYEIYIMNVDGSNVRQLTYNNTDDNLPRVSPDGQRIAFISNRDGNEEVYVMNRDGSEQARLTFDSAQDRLPAWSPDGSEIVFQSNRDGLMDIFIMNADGSNVRQITDSPLREGHTSWSPDGRRLAYNASMEFYWQLYVSNADGTDVRKITNSTYDEWSPEWSPDGQWLLFHSERDSRTNPGIYMMRPDGSDARLIYNAEGEEWGASWSADGQHILFALTLTATTDDLYIMDADGGNVRYLFQEGSYPSWAAGGATSSTAGGTVADTVDHGPLTFTLGSTSHGTPIEVHCFGNGPQKVLFVGGLTGGYAPSTSAVARQAVDYFTREPEKIPDGLTVFIIPLLSPDTITAPGEFEGRLNANGVDLNRNWGCEWTPDPLWGGQIRRGSGGPEPFSEAENRLLRDFILSENPAATVFWYARAQDGLVSPGGCGPSVLVSDDLTATFARTSGYRSANFGDMPGAVVNGDATNWLDSVGIPAVSVLLPSFTTVDWENNLNGILAAMAEYAGRPVSSGGASATARPLPTADKTAAACPTAPAGRWSLFSAQKERLGCATNQEHRTSAAFQYYENGTTVWREDIDRVYVLYNNGGFAYFRDDAGPAGYYHSDLLKGAFGYLWNNNETVRSRLGRPLTIEMVINDFAVQDFAGGAAFYFYDNGPYSFALFNDNYMWASLR